MSAPRDVFAEVGDATSFYGEVGGEAVFRAIAARFYQEVAHDPVIRPLYPEEDLAAAEERMRTYLAQFWGGPRTYSALRGHPRLRARHLPFRIGPLERAAWVRCMTVAVGAAGLDDAHREQLLRHLLSTATSLVNTGYATPPR